MKTLQNILNWTKRHWKILFVVTLLAVYIAAKVLAILTPQRPTPPANSVNSWQGITPGYSALSDVYKTLGTPIKTETTDQGTQVSYTSVFPAQPNTVVADKQQTVQFVKTYVLHEQGGNIQDYINKFGTPDITRVDPNIGEGDLVYVFLKQGVVVVAHIAGPVEQLWYFAPTDQNTFLNSLGKELQPENTPVRGY